MSAGPIKRWQDEVPLPASPPPQAPPPDAPIVLVERPAWPDPRELAKLVERYRRHNLMMEVREIVREEIALAQWRAARRWVTA
jgi:hypothetical protein